MGESKVAEAQPATSYHEDIFGDPNIVMDKDQMLQLLDSPDSNSLYPNTSENLKAQNMADVSKACEVACEGEVAKGIAACDLSSLLEQFLEYEEKQGSPQSVTQVAGMAERECKKIADRKNEHQIQEVGKESKCHGQLCIFSGNLQDHNYAIPTYVVNKNSSAPQKPAAGIIEESKGKEFSQQGSTREERTGHCDVVSSVKNNQGESCLDRKRKLSASVENLHGDRPSNGQNLQHDLQKSELIKRQCFERSSQMEVQSSCNRSIELDKSQQYRRERGQKCRKRSYSSESDDSDYGDTKSSSMSNQHSREKRPRCYCTSSEEESEGECKRYNPREFERESSRGKPDLRSRNYPSHDHSNRHKRRDTSRERDERKNKKNARPYLYNIEHERKLNFKFNMDTKNTAKEERRIVYIGRILESMTKDDVWHRFRPFGPIEKVSVHMRDKGDNYAFVTYFEPESAVEAIEKGNSDSNKIKLDLCFGGRRKFCGGTYVDFDSNASYIEEQQELIEENAPASVSNETDFDVLLQMFQKERRKR